MPEEPPVVVEDSSESLQSVDSNSSSSGFSEDSSETGSLTISETSDDSGWEDPLEVLPTVEIRPVPSISARTIAAARLPKNRATKTPIT